jgi:hypothetical protein
MAAVAPRRPAAARHAAGVCKTPNRLKGLGLCVRLHSCNPSPQVHCQLVSTTGDANWDNQTNMPACLTACDTSVTQLRSKGVHEAMWLDQAHHNPWEKTRTARDTEEEGEREARPDSLCATPNTCLPEREQHPAKPKSAAGGISEVQVRQLGV